MARFFALVALVLATAVSALPSGENHLVARACYHGVYCGSANGHDATINCSTGQVVTQCGNGQFCVANPVSGIAGCQ